MRSVALLILCVAASMAAVATEPLSATADPGAANQPASAGAERTLQESLYDFSGSVFIFACSDDGEPLPITDGEPIAIEGKLYERISLVLDGAGGYHYNVNTMPVGLRGTSLTTGEEFHVSETDRVIANNRLAQLRGSYRQSLKMVGKDTHRSFWIVAQGNYNILADGRVTVSRDVLQVECKVQS